MATLSRLRAEAPSAVTLSSAVCLGELLAIVGPLAPATGLAGLVARRAVSLGLLEVVDVHVSALRCPGDDLIPLDGLDVAEVVVVEDADRPDQDVWNSLCYCTTSRS